jgi:LacI family transcriptional regulator
MKDIADEVGVSVVTVSRAFNNKPDISKKTKDRILEIASGLGFTPNTIAKSLVTQRTKTIGVLIPNTVDNFFAEIIQGIADGCFENDFSIDLCQTETSSTRELEYLRLLQGKRVEGILVYPVQEDNRYIEELKNNTIPFVFLNRHTEDFDNNYVINDNAYGAYLAIDHLIKKGHKKIIYICAKLFASSGSERIKGCKMAVTENNLPANTVEIIECKPTIKSCYNIVSELINNNINFSALFIWDDKLASGAFRALHEAHLQIPDDIAVIGYNDMEISEYFSPPLTTVRQGSYDIGKTAANILINQLNSSERSKKQKIILKPELIIREST